MEEGARFSRDQDLDPAGYDRLIRFMESPRYQLLQQQFTRETVEHLLVRLGFRMSGPDAYNEIQEQMAYLRKLWAMNPSLEDRVDMLDRRLDASEVRQAERFDAIMKAIENKHTENKDALSAGAIDRAAIRTEISSMKTTSMVQIILLLLGAIGLLISRYVLP